MATLGDELWRYNLAKVIVVDVTDDYRFMQRPMPSDFYPVVGEVWLPRFNIKDMLATPSLLDGYLYDWHESPIEVGGDYYVGVVKESLARPASA